MGADSAFTSLAGGGIDSEAAWGRPDATCEGGEEGGEKGGGSGGSKQAECRLLVEDSGDGWDKSLHPHPHIQSMGRSGAYLFLPMLNAQRNGDDQDTQKQQERGP